MKDPYGRLPRVGSVKDWKICFFKSNLSNPMRFVFYRLPHLRFASFMVK